MRKRLAQIALTAFLLASARQITAQSRSIGLPVAIDKLPSGSLFVLDGRGEVHAVDFPGGKPVVTGSFPLPSGWTASDIAAAQWNGQDVLFVAVNYGLTGRVALFSTTGSLLKPFWSLPNGAAGIAYDASSSTLYVASGRTPEIFKIEVSKNAGPRLVARTPGSQRLGPLLFDAKDNALLVGDFVMGIVYKLDLARRGSTVLCGGLSSPTALKLSPDGTSLYVSDDMARKVVAISMVQPKSHPRDFANLREFRSPSGLAWVGDRLAVSDDGAHRLFFLTKGGSLEEALPPVK